MFAQILLWSGCVSVVAGVLFGLASSRAPLEVYPLVIGFSLVIAAICVA